MLSIFFIFIMLLYQTFILFFLSLVLSCNALLCTNNCYFTYNLTTPFSIPERCNSLVLAGKCIVSLNFWYNREEYDVSFRADPTSTVLVTDNRRYALLEFSPTIATFFCYSIDRVCKNKDDCARDLAAMVAGEMLQRYYNYSAIMNNLEPFVTGPPLTPDNPSLNCYDSNQNIHQCDVSTQPGSCAISEIISKKETSIQCDTEVGDNNAYVSIYQSDSGYASFDVHCNRSLCNTYSTLQATKELMFRYNVTKTADGRLSGSQLIISTSLMIMVIFILFSNQF